MPHVVKEGDAKTLRWDLGRDLSGVSEARVLVSRQAGTTPALNRLATIEDAPGGIVALALADTDFGDGKLQGGSSGVTYMVEVETLPGPLTHPDDGYEYLTVLPDLG